MRWLVVGMVMALSGVGCDSGGGVPQVSQTAALQAAPARSLTDARREFKTQLKSVGDEAKEPFEAPPPGVFEHVTYSSDVGDLGAYLTPDPGDGQRHPAIVWMTGGDCNTIGDVWSPKSPTNDQTAAAYRQAGIVMLFPSLRGGNTNPGQREGFLGEVDDVLAATNYLAKQAYVDPKRIYLGGHSTGGTLVLLVAESSDRFRAVFSFGPVDDVGGYDPSEQPFRTDDSHEVAIRSPGKWLDSIQSPTFAFEGSQQGNMVSLRTMERSANSPLIHFFSVSGANHFSVLGPTNNLIARKILADTGPQLNIKFSSEELDRLIAQ